MSTTPATTPAPTTTTPASGVYVPIEIEPIRLQLGVATPTPAAPALAPVPAVAPVPAPVPTTTVVTPAPVNNSNNGLVIGLIAGLVIALLGLLGYLAFRNNGTVSTVAAPVVQTQACPSGMTCTPVVDQATRLADANFAQADALNRSANEMKRLADAQFKGAEQACCSTAVVPTPTPAPAPPPRRNQPPRRQVAPPPPSAPSADINVHVGQALYQACNNVSPAVDCEASLIVR